MIKNLEKTETEVPLSKISPHPKLAYLESLVHPLKDLPKHHDEHHDEHHDGHHDDHHDHAPRDTQKEEAAINAYNALIKQLRNDIHMQK